MKTTVKLWIGIAVLMLLSPLGLLLPAYLKSGDAWGEWSNETLRGLVGYIPAGLRKLSSLWSVSMPDYAFSGRAGASLATLSIVYVICAAIGIIVCIGIVFLLGKLLRKNRG